MRGFVFQDNNNNENLLVQEPQLQSINSNDVDEGLDVDVGLNDIRLLRAQQQLLLVQMKEQQQLHQLHLQQQRLQHYSPYPYLQVQSPEFMQDRNAVPSLPRTLHSLPHNVAPNTKINTTTIDLPVDNNNQYHNNVNQMIPTRPQRSSISLPLPFRIATEPNRAPAPHPNHDLQNMPINLNPDEEDYDGSNGNTTDDLLSLLLLDERDDEFEVALKAATVASCRPSSNESSPCLYEGNNYASSKTNNMMTVGGDYGIDSTPMFDMLPQDLQNQFSPTSQEVGNNHYHNYQYQSHMPQTSLCAESRTGSRKIGDSTTNNQQQQSFDTYNNNNTFNNINDSYNNSNSAPSTIASSSKRQREVSFANNEKNNVGVLDVEENITTNIQQQAQQHQHQQQQPLTNEQQNALIFLQPLTSEERYDITRIMDAMKEKFSGPSQN